MGFARKAIRSVVETSGVSSPEAWLVSWLRGGSDSAAGVTVNPETAMNFVDYFAGVRAISEDIGSLPFPVYERLQPRGKRRAPNHPLYELLHDQVNDLMTSQQFREVITGNALSWGDGYSFIERDTDGFVIGLWPLRPDRMAVRILKKPSPVTGKVSLLYRYMDPMLGIDVTLLPDEVLHVAGLSFDGLRGYSLVEVGRNALGLGIATERFGSTLFKNGSRPGGVMQAKGNVSKPARARMKDDWEEMHQGLDRAQRIAILEEGVEWKEIGIPPNDAQFLETRELQKSEMATLIRISPHKIGDFSHATYSNIEHAAIEHVVDTIRPWCVRWEQAIRHRLFTDVERGRFFAELLLDGLMRGDMKSRYDAYAVARQWGWENADDIREVENLNPIEDGSGAVYLVPLNMMNAADLIDDGSAAGGGPRGRARRSVEGRRKIAGRFRALFEDTDRRLARMEQAEVESLVRRLLDKGQADEFGPALEKLYVESIVPRSVDRWLPPMSVLAGEIARDAADEAAWIGGVDFLDRFVRTYVAGHVARVASSTKGRIRAAATQGADEVRLVLAELVDDRPVRTAARETTRLPSAVARETWRHAGVTSVRWVLGDESCPLCAPLDGRSSEIDVPFLRDGDELAADGVETVTVGSDVFYPPAHAGCTCAIALG